MKKQITIVLSIVMATVLLIVMLLSFASCNGGNAAGTTDDSYNESYGYDDGAATPEQNGAYGNENLGSSDENIGNDVSVQVPNENLSAPTAQATKVTATTAQNAATTAKKTAAATKATTRKTAAAAGATAAAKTTKTTKATTKATVSGPTAPPENYYPNTTPSSDNITLHLHTAEWTPEGLLVSVYLVNGYARERVISEISLGLYLNDTEFATDNGYYHNSVRIPANGKVRIEILFPHSIIKNYGADLSGLDWRSWGCTHVD